MKCNIGQKDRALRIVLGLVIIGLGFYYQNWLGAIGAVPLLTAALGWCPAYVPLKISTVEDKKGGGCGCSCSCK
jgi:hypothetical protein